MRRSAKERDFRNRLRFDHYEALYRESVLRSTEPGVGNDLPETLTVSLTSFGTRIETVYLTIESLMQHSLKADKIVLTLDRNNFSEANLPATLKKQRDRGLEILFCEEDLGPYTKFYYTLQKYPDDLLITVDDDLIYPIDTIDPLYRAYQKEPDVIHCNRGHRMLYAADGKLLPYKKWQWNYSGSEASLDLFPTGVGGVLYFPGSLDFEALDKNTFMALAPKADDVWLKAMSLKKRIECRQVENNKLFSERAVEIEGSQQISLKHRNKQGRFGNDNALERVFNHHKLNRT